MLHCYGIVNINDMSLIKVEKNILQLMELYCLHIKMNKNLIII